MSPSSRTFECRTKILSVGSDRPRGIFLAAGSGSGLNLRLRFFDSRCRCGLSKRLLDTGPVQGKIALGDADALLDVDGRRPFGFGKGFSVQCEIALEDTNTLLGFECASSSSLVIQFIFWSKLSKNFKPCCCAVNEEFLHSGMCEHQMACNFA